MLYYLKLIFKNLKNLDKVWLNFRNLWLNRKVRVFIVSYPKTGRTWLRVMLGRVLTRHFNLPEELSLKTGELTEKAGLLRTAFSHGGPFNLMSFAPYNKLKFNRRLYSKKKVIFLVRDIRDVLVSSYFQETKREKIYHKDIKSFIRDDKFGAKKITAFYNLWFENRKAPKNFLLISYEEMHQDTPLILKKVLDFIGAKAVPEPAVKEAVQFSSLKNMRKMEQQNKFKDSRMQSAKPGDSNAMKARKGKVGGFVDYFDQNDLDYIEKAVKEAGSPDCRWFFLADNFT